MEEYVDVALGRRRDDGTRGTRGAYGAPFVSYIQQKHAC